MGWRNAIDAPREWPERVCKHKEQAAAVGDDREPERQADGRREREDGDVDAEGEEEVGQHETACSARDGNRRRQLVNVQLKDRRGLRTAEAAQRSTLRTSNCRHAAATEPPHLKRASGTCIRSKPATDRVDGRL